MPAPGGSTRGDPASGGDVAVLTRAETDLGVRVLGLPPFSPSHSGSWSKASPQVREEMVMQSEL